MASKWIVLGLSAAFVGVAACASIFGVTGGELLDGAIENDGSPSDAIIDVPFDYQTFDVVTLDVNTAVCDGGVATVDAGDAVWVSATLGDDIVTCGTQGAPCKTIAQAISVLGSKKVIYIDNAIYNERVTLAAAQANVTLQGGWLSDAGWTLRCDNGVSTIASDGGGPATLDITNTHDVTLRLMTIQSRNGNPGTGESVYAVRVVSSPNVTIDNVNMLSEHGGQGSVGTTAMTSFGCFPGGDGGGGAQGAAGGPGSFSQNNFVPAWAGDGGGGSSGSSGAGSDGSCGSCNQGCN